MSANVGSSVWLLILRHRQTASITVASVHATKEGAEADMDIYPKDSYISSVHERKVEE